LEGCRGGRGGRSEREGREGRWEGDNGRAAAYTWQLLSALHFSSQIIKDDYRLPFLEIIISWTSVNTYINMLNGQW
jgi:hypothetical protein